MGEDEEVGRKKEVEGGWEKVFVEVVMGGKDVCVWLWMMVVIF